MRHPLSLAVAALGGAALLFALSLHPSVHWRMEVLRLKALGRLSTVSSPELLGRLLSADPEYNGGRWVMGSATLRDTRGEAPCPATFDTPLGVFHADLADEFDVEWFVDKFLGLNLAQTSRGLMPRIEPGDVVIELGGWVGVFTRYALRQGAAKVVVLEPVADTRECFRRAFAAELEDGRVELIEAAAWDRAGRLRMTLEGPNNYTGGTEGWHVADEGPLEVAAVTVDAVVAELGLERVDLLEMDIEGAERHALAGARGTIRRFAPEIAVCVHHLPDDPEAIAALMREIRPEYQVRADDRHALYF
ncbi:MAG: FkbM family methyltransferase [Acidobacteria bacterium]|nr:FkbM family methyltransferase [Acidobacteriota bacterium]